MLVVEMHPSFFHKKVLAYCIPFSPFIGKLANGGLWVVRHATVLALTKLDHGPGASIPWIVTQFERVVF